MGSSAGQSNKKSAYLFMAYYNFLLILNETSGKILSVIHTYVISHAQKSFECLHAALLLQYAYVHLKSDISFHSLV
jgi:hypothetical protein